jgi:tetratricopeptide (TPR) repeat protein
MTRIGWLIASVSLATASLFAADTPESLIERGHYKKARSFVQAELNKNPNDAHALYLMSKIQKAFGDNDAAMRMAEQAVKLDGNNSDYHCQLAELSGEKAQKAGMFEKMSLARTMKREGETALTLNPKNVECLEGMMQFYLEAPGIVGGDKQKARELLDRLMAVDPVEGNFAQIEFANHEKQTDKTEGFLLKAVEAGPKNYRAHTALANLYASQKKFDVAEKHAREALRLDPNRAGAYSLLVYILGTQERWKDVDTVLDQAEKNVPDDLNPMFQAGKALLLAGKDLPRAEGYFRKYLSHEPEGGTPPLAAAHWRLGLVMEKEGKKSEAIAEMETALKINPDFDLAKKDLKRLK